MRKLPVYLLLDTSGSMHGEPIESVKNGLQLLHSTLRKDPQALELAFISVITFSSDVRQVVPLTEVSAFQPPSLTASGQTSLSQALKTVAECAAKEVRKGTMEEKGDYKPLVFIMTDGQPTDANKFNSCLADFQKYRWGLVLACAAGPGADTSYLKRITECILVLYTADSTQIAAFFKFVSSSITTASKRIDSGGSMDSMNELPPPPPEISLLKL